MFGSFIQISRIVFCALFLTNMVIGLDVSWLPADADGPLPLSANYRAALSKLCDLMHGKDGSIVPKEIESKRVLINSLCAKLAREQVYSQHSNSPLQNKFVIAAISAAIVGGGVYMIWPSGFGRRLSSQLGISGKIGVSTAESIAIREARLQKFS